MLEDVTYYQVVFTLPSELSEMALANRDELAELLFTSAWKALRKAIRTQQDSIIDKNTEAIRCPSCEGDGLRLIGETPKPSWLGVLDHLDDRCPWWHAEAEKAWLIESLEREYGVDYDTWLLETRIESARGPEKPLAATQPWLPGLSPPGDMLLESY